MAYSTHDFLWSYVKEAADHIADDLYALDSIPSAVWDDIPAEYLTANDEGEEASAVTQDGLLEWLYSLYDELEPGEFLEILDTYASECDEARKEEAEARASAATEAQAG